jgi:hypothetical protein
LKIRQPSFTKCSTVEVKKHQGCVAKPHYRYEGTSSSLAVVDPELRLPEIAFVARFDITVQSNSKASHDLPDLLPSSSTKDALSALQLYKRDGLS